MCSLVFGGTFFGVELSSFLKVQRSYFGRRIALFLYVFDISLRFFKSYVQVPSCRDRIKRKNKPEVVFIEREFLKEKRETLKNLKQKKKNK